MGMRVHWRGVAVLALLGLATVLAGCVTTSGGMSQEQCYAADWNAMGYRDGRAGRDTSRFARRAQQCLQFGEFADEALYRQGHDRGLAELCTPMGGLDFGRRGRSYNHVCPIERESGFLAAYNAARRFRALEHDYEHAEDDVERIHNRIDHLAGKLANRTAKLVAEPNHPDKEKTVARIAELTVALAKKRRDAADARRDLRYAQREFFAYQSRYQAYEAALHAWDYERQVRGGDLTVPPPPPPY